MYNGTGRQVANTYAHFGFPHIWPRGYPLDQIRPEAQQERFSRLQARPLILQGLADKDPDVDAIFRQAELSHAHRKRIRCLAPMHSGLSSETHRQASAQRTSHDVQQKVQGHPMVTGKGPHEHPLPCLNV